MMIRLFDDNRAEGNRIIHVLDIRNDVCPLTFVKTRLLIERMGVGDVAAVLLRGEEPIQNVPASVTEQWR